MNLEKVIRDCDLVLTEAAVTESIGRAGEVILHPHLGNALLIYDEAGELNADDISDWGERMIELNRRFGVRILGGCCGTRLEHLQYIVNNIHSKSGTVSSVINDEL